MPNLFAEELTNALAMTLGDLARDVVERGCRRVGTTYDKLNPDHFEDLMATIRDSLEQIYPPEFVDVVITKIVLAIKGRF